MIEADSEDKKRRRLGRSRRNEVEVPPPIKLLVRKAEPAKPIDTDVPGLPLPRAQHVHFPSSDDHPEASASQPAPSALPDGTPEQAQSVDKKQPVLSTKAGEASSGSMVDLLAPRPEERHQAKAEVRKLKKGHTREYVWDGKSPSYTGDHLYTSSAEDLRRSCLEQSSSRTREGAYHACLRNDQRDSLLILPYRPSQYHVHGHPTLFQVDPLPL